MVTNSHINDVRGAVKAFQSIDFERLADSGLQSRITLYLASSTNDEFNFNVTVKFRGPVKSIKGFSHVGFMLPTPIFELGNSDYSGFNTTFLTEACVPKRVDLVLEARTQEEYSDLNSFLKPDSISRGLQNMVDSRYGGYNPEHTSIALLYVGEDLETTKPIFYVSREGLKVREDRLIAENGTEIFTDADVKRFMDLRPSEDYSFLCH